MATQESGHYINVANLNLANGYIASWGTLYNPAKIPIQKPNLILLYTNGNLQIENVQTAKNGYGTAVGRRKEAFIDIHTYSTRIMGGLAGTNVSEDTIKHAHSINLKIQGTRAVEPDTDPSRPDVPAPQTHSVSRQSYDSLYENFSDLTNLLKNAANYDPNETEFQIPALQAYTLSLKTANEALDTAIVLVANKRVARNHFLYDPKTGLVDIALDAKDYVKGLFGAASPEYKLIHKIKFRNR